MCEDCKKYDGLLSLYIDGELPQEKTRYLMDHLAVCPDCLKRLELMRILTNECSALSEDPPAGLHGQIMDRIRCVKKRQKPAGFPISFLKERPFTLAAAACLILALAASGIFPDLNRVYVFGRPSRSTDMVETAPMMTVASEEGNRSTSFHAAGALPADKETEAVRGASNDSHDEDAGSAGFGSENKAPSIKAAIPQLAAPPEYDDLSWTVTIYSKSFAYFMHAVGGTSIPEGLDAALYADFAGTSRYHIFAGASEKDKTAVIEALQGSGFHIQLVEDHEKIPQLDAMTKEGLVVVDIVR